MTSFSPARDTPWEQPTAGPIQGGFTLLEMLVVVLIIGITLGLVVPSLNPDQKQDLEEESQRMITLIRMGAEEAVLQGQEYAMELAPDGYRFLALTESQWLPLEDELLRPRQLPERIHLEVFFEGQRFDFLRNEEEAEEEHPRLYILSSGEMTPMEILLSSTDSEYNYRVIIDINGKIRTER